MKRTLYLLIIILSSLGFASCTESVLDATSNSLTVENWYNTADDFQMAINSCYVTMMGKGMHGRLYPLFFGVWDDRTLFETTGRDRLTTNSSEGEVEDIFDELYQGVYRTSKVLEQLHEKGVDGIREMTEENYKYIEAQAKALRALYYFHLVIIFDRPFFYNEDNIPQDLLKEFTNADQVMFWDQIEKDLEEAIPNLKYKSDLPDEDVGRITKGAAGSLLGKALLFKHYYYHERFGKGGSEADIADLEKARDALSEVIGSNEYELVKPLTPFTRKDYLYALLCNTSFKDLPSENNVYKSENNMESVWEIQFSDAPMLQNNPWLPGYFGSGSLNMQFFSPHETSYRNIEANPSFYWEFETEGAPEPFDRDPRCYATFYFDGESMDFDPESPYYAGINPGLNYKTIARGRKLTTPPSTEGLPVKKHYFPVYWEGENAPFNDPTNKRLIRYADVLLLYAEVMYILGDDGTGLNALNQVRGRVDMPPVDVLTPDVIIHERDVELGYEYHRWFDLVRWSFDPQWATDWNEIDWGINAQNTVNPFVVGKHEFLPIPIKEIDLSGGNLEQNPGW
ncbi:MAG: RagB/SusD family nutrient uptake outer membrane protein [Bacteroidales bacterium]|nr:RagB/SusD family nutrient uptake outer membrane protein [Bacteroidales bacterium]